MRLVQNILDAATYSNIFISVCVCCFTWQTALFFEVEALYVWHLSLVNTIATFILYNLQRLYHATQSQTDARSEWVQKHRRLLFTMILLAGSISLKSVLFFWELHKSVLVLYVVLAVFSLSYFLPPLKLRRYGRLKPFLIAFVYASCCILPVYLTLKDSLSEKHLFYFIAQFVWITAVCTPFDIRDMDADRERSIVTFPVRYGVKGAIYLGFALVLLYSLLMYFYKSEPNVAPPLALIAISTALIIGFSSPKRTLYYFSLLTDGLILFQFMVWVWSK